MKSRSRNLILSAIIFGILIGVFDVFRYGISWGALIYGVVSGSLFGVLMYFFSNSKKVKQQAQVEITEDDVLIYSGDANHSVKLEGVGGKLYLFSNRLQFQSHNFNIQNHGLIIEITQIAKVTFYNTLGLIPNGLAITTTEGKREKFVVNNRNVWRTEIEKLLNSNINTK